MHTILAYGDSNTWGAVPLPARGPGRRYPADKRWPSVMGAALGAGFAVIAEGLNGRTTCLDDSVEGRHKNGEAHLLATLESHQPLDLVIVMLGTNDLKARFRLPAGDIAAGMGRLARLAQVSRTGPDQTSPKVLIVCPAPLARLDRFAEMFAGGTETSRKLAAAARLVAEETGAAFMDAGSVIASSDVDGIHLDEHMQRALGLALAERVRGLLGPAGG
jgi:lysophospholipase L1-like esterase